MPPKKQTTAKKKTTAKKSAPKRRTTAAKPAPAPIRPVKDPLTKSALVGMIAEKNECTRKEASNFLASLEEIMMGSIHPRGVGEFMLPGMFKITLRKIPARKAGAMVRNPATGEMVPGKAKPASIRVKMRPLAKLKAAATK